MADRTYYTLLIKQFSDGPWAIEFGDYDRACVKDELAGYRDNDWPLKDLKIITTGDTQAEIDAAVAALNAH